MSIVYLLFVLMKLLKDILYKTGIEEIYGTSNVMIKDVCFDSRKVNHGSVFVATTGTHSDGHQFIEEVIEKGCMAIVLEKFPQHRIKEVTYVRVKDSAYALSIMASNFFDNPSEKLKLVGIT